METLRGPRLGAVLFALPALASCETPVARETMDLREIPRCSSCTIEPRLLVNLGEESGDGIIGSEQVFVAHSSAYGYAVHWIGGHSVLLFDQHGAFQRRVGTRGEGPGEIGYLGDGAVRLTDRHIVALDLVRPKFVIMDYEGRHVGDHVVDALPIGFRMLSDATAAVGTTDRGPERAGVPLYLLDLGAEGTGRRAARPPDVVGGDVPGVRPAAGRVRLGSAAEEGRLWLRQGSGPLEQWSLGAEARRLRTVFGWEGLFRVDDAGQEERGLPRVMTGSFLSDRSGRLWLASRVLNDPALTWEDIPPRTSGGERLIPSAEMGRYYSTRIDVYDLGEARHVGSFVWDHAPLRLVLVHGEVASYHVAYDGAVPVVSVFGYDVPVARGAERR